MQAVAAKMTSPLLIKAKTAARWRAPLTRTRQWADAANLPEQRLHGDKRMPRVSLVLFDTEVKYFIVAI